MLGKTQTRLGGVERRATRRFRCRMVTASPKHQALHGVMSGTDTSDDLVRWADPRGLMVGLSEGTRKRIDVLFAEAERAEVVKVITDESGNNLPFCEGDTPEDLERIRFAVLKLSEGDTTKLRDAIRLAQIDWRDLLVAAGFADDLQAHSRWWPR
jgi:hypothetical protein